MKAQVNVEFIVSAGLTIVVFGFIIFNIMNNIPVLHRESSYEIEKSQAYIASQMLVSGSGIWNGPSISNVSLIGLTDGVPYVLNYTKVMALNCTSPENYTSIKKLIGFEYNRNFIINISRIYAGGIENIAQCNRSVISTASPKVWISRIGVLNQSGIMNMVRIELAIY